MTTNDDPTAHTSEERFEYQLYGNEISYTTKEYSETEFARILMDPTGWFECSFHNQWQPPTMVRASSVTVYKKIPKV